MIQWISELLGLSWQNVTNGNYNTYIITIAAVLIIITVATFFAFLFDVLEGVFRR